eukprot:TRINITY_DN24743_c0_g1_i1.p1 TRINITY_DN24743_c0_g1~~TRINITY_DN24743_c0_g1_i1.p1  ORF type:complete len:138 (+),score=15.61 TRINITY_DN24743_c0_g1_i1:656-1069(+)
MLGQALKFSQYWPLRKRFNQCKRQCRELTTLTGRYKCGTNGTQFSQSLQGNVLFTAPNILNLGAVSQTVTFSSACAFATTPDVYLSLAPIGGSTFMDGLKATCGAGTISTTGFVIQLKNVSGSTTTGNLTCFWTAMV